MSHESKEPEESAPYTHFSATLRVFGAIDDLDEITATLGIIPTHLHRRGDRRTPRSRPFEQGMWSYLAPVPESRPLDDHLQALWTRIQPRRDALKRLKERFTVDVFCGYRSNREAGGFAVSYHSLRMFLELEIPLEVSVIA